MNKLNNYLLINQFEVLGDTVEISIAMWQKIYINFKNNHCLYLDTNDNSLLELVVLKNVSDLEASIESKEQFAFEELIKHNMVSDWRRQLLTLKEIVIPAETLFKTDYIQLRHIEVPLRVYSDYLSWREKTIFHYVTGQDAIEYFIAYHTMVSTNPGVIFLSGFSCSVDNYLAIFNQTQFAKIAKEATEKYIRYGKDGLLTKIYKRVSN